MVHPARFELATPGSEDRRFKGEHNRHNFYGDLAWVYCESSRIVISVTILCP